MSKTPKFTKTDAVARVRVAAANTATDGSGTINAFLKEDNSTQFSGNALGSRIKRLFFTNSQATAAASSAMVVKLWVSDNTGSNWRILREFALATATRSTTAIGARDLFSFIDGFDIGSGVKIGITQSVYAGVQDQMDYVLEYSDYDA